MVKDGSENGYKVKCPKCGISGSVTDKDIDIECGCGEVFSYSEPKKTVPIFDIVSEEEEKPKKQEKRMKKTEPEIEIFLCNNCKSEVKKNASECEGCGFNLEWE